MGFGGTRRFVCIFSEVSNESVAFILRAKNQPTEQHISEELGFHELLCVKHLAKLRAIW